VQREALAGRHGQNDLDDIEPESTRDATSGSDVNEDDESAEDGDVDYSLVQRQKRER
jgi:hypothetical protein